MNNIALYAGTFDPITYGHLDIIQRALNISETLVIAVAQNKNKTPMLTLDERANLIKQLMKSHHQVKVITFDNLLIDCAKSHGATILIRGIRNSTDFNYEYQLANTNRALAPQLETVFLLPSPANCHISSTFVREINELGGSISEFVPPLVETAMKNKHSMARKE